MLRVFNDTARYVDQGGGKRKGSFAIYIETWHADVLIPRFEKRIQEKKRCARDLFFAMWTLICL
jgi:ribonucleoside-diphosphate reductase alpha chain